MKINDIKKLKYGDKLIYNQTGEEIKFVQYQGLYLMCFDNNGFTIWLDPEKVENAK